MFSSINLSYTFSKLLFLWQQLDNHGNHVVASEESAINIPAVAAAHVIKRYMAQAPDEISIEVNEVPGLSPGIEKCFRSNFNMFMIHEFWVWRNCILFLQETCCHLLNWSFFAHLRSKILVYSQYDSKLTVMSMCNLVVWLNWIWRDTVPHPLRWDLMHRGLQGVLHL